MMAQIESMGRVLWKGARAVFFGPQILAFVPALTLGGYWFAGESALLVMAISIPAAMGLVSVFSGQSFGSPTQPTPVFPDVTVSWNTLVEALDVHFATQPRTGLRSAAFQIEIDDFDTIQRDYGLESARQVADLVGERLTSALRQGDLVARTGDNGFAIALAPMRDIDLETLIMISSRIQDVVAHPISTGGMPLFLSACVGFCGPNRDKERDGQVCLDAAASALQEAQAAGASSIRAFSPSTARRATSRPDMANEIEEALEKGQIVPWFQPQLSTDTGEISGMEALARWHHPERGVILPAAFLPTLAAAGLNPKLGEVMLSQSLSTLKKWDESDIWVPTVSVNFSQDELSDPTLVDRIQWELDRFDLSSDRLVVEVLETVISGSDNDTITRNVNQLGALGCGIDLDDFGTGNASIASIRRFNVGRIKIDRSFVTDIDTDLEQRSLLAAILEMAERLGVETLAEGVETPGEHTLLGQLGCGYVQGYLIARPMPFADTLDWAQNHTEQIATVPPISRNIG